MLAWLTDSDNARTLVFALGLVLLGAGLALVSIPAALIIPGAILVWLAIPPAPRSSSRSSAP